MNSCLTTNLPAVDVDLSMGDHWNSTAVSELIRSRSRPGESPAFLFLGKHEARLLRAHLGAAFGDDAVASLKDLYYMGLEVCEIDMERFLRVAGRKTARTLQDPVSRRPAWRDRETSSRWNLRIA